MKQLLLTAGLAAWASSASAATLFLVDPSSVTTSPVVTSQEPFSMSGPVMWNGGGGGLFEGAFSAADIDQRAAQFGINAGDTFNVWTLAFDGPGPWRVGGTFAPGTVPIWALGSLGQGGGQGDNGGGGGKSVGGGGGGSNLGDPGGVSSVPEPATWVTLGVGFLALTGVGLLKRKRTPRDIFFE